PAFVLALALLGVLAAVAGPVWVRMRMAPSTLLQTRAEAAAANPDRHGVPAPAVPAADAQPQTEAGPGWETLSTQQKLALDPLAERWARISEAQKRRWLTLAASYPALSEQEREKFRERITDWANLSAQQRNQARLNYAVTTRLARDDKRAQWEAYQALSDEERRALAARAAPRPVGAATALHPVSPKKLAQVPAATQANPGRPNAPKIAPVVAQSPRAAAPVVPAALAAPPPPAGNAPQSPPAAFTGVEAAPVAASVAVPTALPPLGAGAGAGEGSPAAALPDNAALHPQ
ncbi:DUF3106 domain-containing protein, partial [Verminephrobacter aporrectodeae]|uniref:DUF3106 domain-containing protein n=2 Tax=Verminephrobacter aporrectodeae TaxID=1110389 RepID=UPI0022432C01